MSNFLATNFLIISIIFSSMIQLADIIESQLFMVQETWHGILKATLSLGDR